VARDQRDKTDKTDQRTRLNAELAFQYARGGVRKKAEPGRGGLSEELGDLAEGEVETELDASAHEANAGEQADAAQAIAPEAKKSIFELPRREPARPALPSDTVAPGAPGGPSKPK
jgi:hypothetical protein